MCTELKRGALESSSERKATVCPLSRLPSSRRRGNWDLELTVKTSRIPRGSDTRARHARTPRRSGLVGSSQMGYPLLWEVLGARQDTNPPPRNWNQTVGNPGSSIRTPRPEWHSTSLFPVYRSCSRTSNYQRESRPLRNMSTHDITWKRCMLIGASYNLSGSRMETGSL